jgi:uncharacterized protein (TIGR02271 family)
MLERFRDRISEGMQVKSSDGEKLGKVVLCQASGFLVEKGFLFPKDQLIPYERITGIHNGEILISLARAEVGEAPAGRVAAAASGVAADVKGAGKSIKEAVTGAATEARATLAEVGAKGAPKSTSLGTLGEPVELRVDLVEEEIVTRKHVERVGEIHVRKEVITEEKQITVPVMREVIRVERVSVSHDVRPDGKAFEKESYDIPVSEERVDVEKRAVVREEIHIGKEIERAEEIARANVRRERAEIETLGPVRRADAPSNDQSALRPTGTGGARR